MFDPLLLRSEGLTALRAAPFLQVRVVLLSRYLAHTAALVHLSGGGAGVYYSVEVGTSARLHLWLVSEQFFKLPVK